MRPDWKRLRHKLEWFALAGVARIVPWLPYGLCWRLAHFAGALAARFDRRGRRVATENLRLAFGEIYSPAEREKIARESYQHFARSMLELFWSRRLTTRNFSDYIDFTTADFDSVGIKVGEPFIFGTYHYSNFEWLSLAGGFLGHHGSIITQEFKNPLLDPVFKRLREQSGHEMVAREGAIIRLYKALRRGRHAAVLVDLTIPPKIPTVVIDCFGLKTSVTFAHAWLHERTGAPLMTAHCEPLPGGRYRVIVHRPKFPPGASRQQIAQACWDEFEPYVRRNPGPWLWMYKHWRYRPASAAKTDYPFYANFSEDFEVRLAESVPAVPPPD